MCIRTANGRFLACCSFLVVIMFGLVTEAFAQREMGPPQPSGGEGRNVILPPGDGNGNSGGNPGGFPWWLQPNGNIPIPGSGIGNPVGEERRGGSGGAPPQSKDCDIFCTCQQSIQNQQSTATAPGCTIPDNMLYVISVTKSYTKKSFHECNDVNKTEVCSGTGGTYTGFVLLWTQTLHSGCDDTVITEVLRHRIENGGLPPTNFSISPYAAS